MAISTCPFPAEHAPGIFESHACAPPGNSVVFWGILSLITDISAGKSLSGNQLVRKPGIKIFVLFLVPFCPVRSTRGFLMKLPPAGKGGIRWWLLPPVVVP